MEPIWWPQENGFKQFTVIPYFATHNIPLSCLSLKGCFSTSGLAPRVQETKVTLKYTA